MSYSSILHQWTLLIPRFHLGSRSAGMSPSRRMLSGLSLFVKSQTFTNSNYCHNLHNRLVVFFLFTLFNLKTFVFQLQQSKSITNLLLQQQTAKKFTSNSRAAKQPKLRKTCLFILFRNVRIAIASIFRPCFTHNRFLKCYLFKANIVHRTFIFTNVRIRTLN